MKKHNIKLYYVTIGPPERGIEFAKLTGFPEEQLLADPDSNIYKALGFKNSVLDTFFNVQTPLSIAARIKADGAKALRQAIGSWNPWIPPKQNQAFQQGGGLMFHGKLCVWQYYDPATGAHVKPEVVLDVALKDA